MGLRLLVTGGAGFVGSAVVRRALRESAVVLNVDKLTYAGNLETVADVAGHPNYRFLRADIADAGAMAAAFADFQPDAVVHLAAESHVDRSIDGPRAFIDTNVVGSCVLLETARRYLAGRPDEARERFRFVHVSTDEVYGSLDVSPPATEGARYDPSSPYAASKAAADHLARAWHRTFGLPVLVTNSTNNYGPYQYPEKLIPVAVLTAAAGRPVPLYGTGAHVRDWLHVDDHAEALWQVLTRGHPGATYNVSARCERSNAAVIEAVCSVLDDLLPEGRPHRRHVNPVTDRPGHDGRYALDPGRIERDLGWRPRIDFAVGLAATVGWYLANHAWCEVVLGGDSVGRRRGLAGRGTAAAGAEARG